jgi:hypothetical protein
MTWLKSKLTERSSMDGILMVAAGAAIIVFSPLTQMIAYAAIAWGAWTIWRKE